MNMIFNKKLVNTRSMTLIVRQARRLFSQPPKPPKLDAPFTQNTNNTSTPPVLDQKITNSPIKNPFLEHIEIPVQHQSTSDIGADINLETNTDSVRHRSYIDKDGNEKIVIYEVDKKGLSEIKKDIALRYTGIFAAVSGIIAVNVYGDIILMSTGSLFFLYLLSKCVISIKNILQNPIRISLNWSLVRKPQIATFNEYTDDVYGVLKNQFNVPTILEHSSEFSQRFEHNELIDEKDLDRKIKESDEYKLKMAQKKLTIDSNSKYYDIKERHNKKPFSPSYIFDMVNVDHVEHIMKAANDPNLPETVTIDRLGSRTLTEPLKNFKAEWAEGGRAKNIQFNQSHIEMLKDEKYIDKRVVLLLNNKLLITYPRYVSDVTGYNQLIHTANLNSRIDYLKSVLENQRDSKL